jgi:hypothetical protein
MEFVLVILFYAVLFFGIGRVFRAITSTTKAVVKTVNLGGTLSGNLKEEFRDMGAFEVEVRPTKIKIAERDVDAYAVFARGVIPAPYQSDLLLVTSIFDSTTEKFEGVMCSLDFMQEEKTESYQTVNNAGKISPNQGYKNWINVATIFPETLTAAWSGNRSLTVVVRAIPPSQLSKIEWGYHDTDIEVFASARAEVKMLLEEKGWSEAHEDRELAKELIVKIALSVACSDGDMNVQEGKAIQAWIREQLTKVSENYSAELKERLNLALKQGYSDFKSNKLDQKKLVAKFKSLNLMSMNQQLLEVLVKVISADSEITQDEMLIVKNIGIELDVDYEEIKAMSDKAFLEMSALDDSDENLESLLGIDPTWDNAKIMSHLRSEFSKWNGRIQALEDESEKEKAQKMLDAISKARQKYGAK